MENIKTKISMMKEYNKLEIDLKEFLSKYSGSEHQYMITLLCSTTKSKISAISNKDVPEGFIKGFFYAALKNERDIYYKDRK